MRYVLRVAGFDPTIYGAYDTVKIRFSPLNRSKHTAMEIIERMEAQPDSMWIEQFAWVGGSVVRPEIKGVWS